MADKSLRDLSPEKLIQRRTMLLVILWIYFVISVAFIGLFIASIVVDDPDFSLPSWAALVIILVWIPMMAYGKVNRELVRRKTSFTAKE